MPREDVNFDRAMAGEYTPAAIYFQEADIVEYVRSDVPTVHRRIDGFLTLVLDMETREPIGFALKGFRNFYVNHMKPAGDDEDFVLLTKVLEEKARQIGSLVFDDATLRSGYETAQSIAISDHVKLNEIPEAA